MDKAAAEVLSHLEALVGLTLCGACRAADMRCLHFGRAGDAGDAAEARFALFAEELDRTRISRPEFDAEKGAAIWGRVVDDGVSQPGLSVSAIGDGVRLDFDCTDGVGSFALELPAKTGLILSVRNKDGAELYRDPEPAELETGQKQYREIDLTRGAEKPCPDPGPDVPPDETFAMLDLVGRTEAAARASDLLLLVVHLRDRGDRLVGDVADPSSRPWTGMVRPSSLRGRRVRGDTPCRSTRTRTRCS